jgi:putative AlgH/UPF0301 family transcriptional regulator
MLTLCSVTGWRPVSHSCSCCAVQVFQLLHGHPLDGSVEVVPGVRLGGEAAAVAEVAAGKVSAADFRFFSGAMVWGPGQLDAQVQQGVW